MSTLHYIHTHGDMIEAYKSDPLVTAKKTTVSTYVTRGNDMQLQ